MAVSDQLEVDRLRVKFPRSYKALIQLYPGAWDQMLAIIEQAMAQGATASVVIGKLSILRGLDREVRRWVLLSIQADRREIVLRDQKSFLTELHDKTLDDILAEMQSLAGAQDIAPRAPGGKHGEERRVFISHHSKTSGKLALKLAQSIEALGGSCWIAPRDIPQGSVWNEELYAAVQKCAALVLLFSEDAAKSPPVLGEVAIAVARGIPVLVVRLSEGDPARVHVALAAYQHSQDWIGCSPADLPKLASRLHAALHAAGVSV